MVKRQSLGRGFEALIPKDIDRGIIKEDKSRVQKLLITDIIPNPDQPRRNIDQKALSELAASIKVHGVMQPIILVKNKGTDKYKIVAGERRWRAAKLAGLNELPAIVRTLKELEQVELSLIENIQRVDLSPLEQAMAVYRLQHQFNLSLKEVSDKLGKALSTVSNIGRLLQLPDVARDALQAGRITEGHARAILALKPNTDRQNELLRCILDNNWTVRQAEEFVLRSRANSKSVDAAKVAQITDKLSTKFKTKIRINQTANGGQIIFTYKDEKDLQRLSDFLQK